VTPKEYGYTLKGSIQVHLRLMSKSNFKPKGRIYLPKRLADFEGAIALLGIAQVGRLKLAEGWLVIRPHFATRIHPDLSNLPKSIMDGLVKGEVFADDKLVAVTVCPAVYERGEHSTLEVWG
jgi:Holliday junction resolvase RusA-like endonuclease